MLKFASELVTKPVLLHKEEAIVGIVSEVIINPDSGELVGILVREGFGKKNIKALPEKDILSITSEYYLISSYDSLGDIDEIVRIKSIVERNISIMGNKVYTVTGKYLGRCRDYTVNMKSLRIDKLYVTPPLLSGAMKEYLIGFSQIVSIEKEKITVEDAFIKANAPAKGQLADLVN